MSASRPRPLRVAMVPDPDLPSANPYLHLLVRGLRELDVDVCAFDRARARAGEFDVVHVQWPERLVDWRRPRTRVVRDCLAVLRSLTAARRRGTAVVWTAHNLRPHDLPRMRWAVLFQALLLRLVDLVVVLSPSARRTVIGAHPALARTPHAVVRHPHYRQSYDFGTARDAPRDGLALDRDGVVFLVLGRIRPYKQVDRLVAAFVREGAAGETLLIAGHPASPELAEAIRAAAAHDPRVRLDLRHIPDDEVGRLHAAADVVLLPYDAPSVLNSGAAILSLSAGRPVVVPSTSAMRDLQAEVGPDWVQPATGDPGGALRAARRLAALDRRSRPPMDRYEPALIAQACLDAYRTAARSARRRP